MSDCIFCKIAEKKIPVHKVYEDKDCFAFLDVKPHAKGHTVVVPKEHAVFISDLDHKNCSNLILAVKKTIEIIKEKLHPDGFNVGWNSGSAAGQVVPHLHLHIIPRWQDDGGGSMHSIIRNPGPESVDEVARSFK